MVYSRVTTPNGHFRSWGIQFFSLFPYISASSTLDFYENLNLSSWGQGSQNVNSKVPTPNGYFMSWSNPKFSLFPYISVNQPCFFYEISILSFWGPNLFTPGCLPKMTTLGDRAFPNFSLFSYISAYSSWIFIKILNLR